MIKKEVVLAVGGFVGSYTHRNFYHGGTRRNTEFVITNLFSSVKLRVLRGFSSFLRDFAGFSWGFSLLCVYSGVWAGIPKYESNVFLD
jgi:hypothetical protein